MEVIKSIVKQFYPLIIMLNCVLFTLWVFFSATIYNGNGVFEGGGKLFAPVLEADETKTEGFNYVSGSAGDCILKVECNAGVQTVGGSISVKNLLSVNKEDDVTIYLMDIRNQTGESVMDTVYDKEQDTMCFHKSGTYVVYIKIYGVNGSQEAYEFRLPVEPR